MRDLLLSILVVAACGGSNSASDDDVPTDSSASDDAPVDQPPGKKIDTVFVIVFENKDQTQIYGNTADAPFINQLMVDTAAHATKFGDVLPTRPSEPHYVWMEAGTNVFADHTFTADPDADAGNSTSSTEHLVNQLEAAQIPWVTYQEGIATGTCPISSSGHYAAKHDPFVFFQDVSGNPPSADAVRCAQHHKSYADFAADLAADTLRGYVFITPDLCNDMHGDLTCSSFIFDGPNIKAGDTWLSNELPRLLDYTATHDNAVVFLVWDEGNSSNQMPFLAVGNHVQAGKASSVDYDHSSYLKSVELLLGVPVLSKVSAATDFRDMFVDGVFAP
jgi:hypothetical protein